MPKSRVQTKRTGVKVTRKPMLKMIVHPDFFITRAQSHVIGRIPQSLMRQWKHSISGMKKDSKKFLLIVPYDATIAELKAAIKSQANTSDLADLIHHALVQLGKQRVIVMNFSVLGRVKDYPMNIVGGQRNFDAGPKERLKKILEGRGIMVEDIGGISASGIYLGTCVAGNAKEAARVLGVPIDKIRYLPRESF